MDWSLDFIKPRHLIMTLALCAAPTIVMADIDMGSNKGLYQQHNLVSDGSVVSDHTDPNLTNPWGIAFGVTNPVWVANNASGTSTLYDGLGNLIPLVVTIPPAPSVGGVGTPTGIVFNNTANWMITSNGQTAAAAFIFASEDGTISGWAPSVNRTMAILAVDNSASGAIYKGLTSGANGTAAFLYAANFASGKIDVFDNAFKPVMLQNGFVDPNLPPGYAPFNVQNLQGNIYVSYAKKDAKNNPIRGKGLGIVNVFDANGKFIRRIATGGGLNAPWGLVFTPANFGKFSNVLLVGNFGDGKINAFDLDSHIRSLGQLRGANGKVLSIDGLWALSFGNGFNNQPTDVLFFTAGPNNETNGIYGKITPIA